MLNCQHLCPDHDTGSKAKIKLFISSGFIPENVAVIINLDYQVNADLSVFLISLAGELNKNI